MTWKKKGSKLRSRKDKLRSDSRAETAASAAAHGASSEPGSVEVVCPTAQQVAWLHSNSMILLDFRK